VGSVKSVVFRLLSEMMLPKTGSGKSRVSGRTWGMVSEISEVSGFPSRNLSEETNLRDRDPEPLTSLMSLITRVRAPIAPIGK
jgi:hypothetical protein